MEVTSNYKKDILLHILFHPKSIVGLLMYFSNTLPIRKLVSSVILFFLASTSSIILHPRTSISSPSFDWIYPLVQTGILSPLAIGLLLENSVPTVDLMLSNLFELYPSLRSEPYPVAIKCIEDGVRRGRIIRHPKFDLYIPPYQDEEFLPGLVFLPGMLVSHDAYANIAKKLSDEGIIVAVLSAEPFRIPWKYLGADAMDVRYIINTAQKLLKEKYLPPSQICWSLGGHSMGAYTSMALAKSLNVRKLIIWAAGNLDELVPDLNYPEISVLSVQGSCDSFATFSDKFVLAKFKKKMPAMTKFVMIKGGNHAGFASYPPPMGFDGKRKISLKSQQNQATEATSKFILDDP